MKVCLKSGKAARRRGGSGGEFPLALGMDAPLRVVAVHDQHVMAERVVQVAGEQRGEGRLSDAALLIADGDA